MANEQFFSGLLGQLVQQDQQKRQMQQALQLAMQKAQIQQQVQQNSPQAKFQQQIMQQFFGGGGQGGGQPSQGGGQNITDLTQNGVGGFSAGGVNDPTSAVRPGEFQRPGTQPQQFITQPSLSIGPRGTTVGINKVANPAIASQQKNFQNAGLLRKEFSASPVFKDFRAIQAQVNQMDALVQNAASGKLNINNALDQALITTFNKINDPGSVVRESEFARTSQNLPVVNRIIGALSKFRKGGAGLTREDRLDLVTAAKIIAAERGELFNQEIDRFNQISKDFQVNPRLVTGGIQKFKKPKIKGEQAQTNLINQKVNLANQIAAQNPNFTREQIMSMVNSQFGERRNANPALGGL